MISDGGVVVGHGGDDPVVDGGGCGGPGTGGGDAMLMSNSWITYTYLALTIRSVGLQRHRKEKTLPKRLMTIVCNQANGPFPATSVINRRGQNMGTSRKKKVAVDSRMCESLLGMFVARKVLQNDAACGWDLGP